jgi:PPIC-type PPIASE domain
MTFPVIPGGTLEMCSFRLVSTLLVTLALANLAFTQETPASSPTPSQGPQQETGNERGDDHSAPTATSNLPPSTPVITMTGVCEEPKGQAPATKSECKTVITRAEFEKLANTLQPNMAPELRQKLANEYPQILYMSQEARKRGLDKDAHYLEVLKFTKMELLKLELERANGQEADKISEAEIKNYHDKNAKTFDQASLLRVYVPRLSQTDMPKTGSSPAEVQGAREKSEAAMANLADNLHTRAAAGEDFEKLQKEAYETAGVKSAAPPTANTKVRRGSLPASQASVFDMKPGELSPVLNEPSGYYFYRLVSKTSPSLAETKAEIRDRLRSQRLQTMHENGQGALSYQLNKEYFGTDATPTQGMQGNPRSMSPNNMRPAPPAGQPKE